MADQLAPANGGEQRSLLIVEDNDRFAEALASEFRDRGYVVQHAQDLAALGTIENLDVDYAVVDLRLGADSGLDAIQEILECSPDTKIVTAPAPEPPEPPWW